eukprot:CAMPEP_0174382930 /NCGR_PEP_ID=MMETSP0811_2-20130205/124899_1 /TAXON_ID=73025 ORGANISM="Eutreptiella gymnastica-like, Strain CCMP1594" /NCGR_SAMPLE_ID=MMETSP0811_2 /ASSEMBLY_ACC=CAM_ASM_000667 /LENGTH=465 /DNA_ID=CAMNT_0015536351 /DNA_START=69 /DNA_END=1466 /DNA_ORIENTATION=-
MSSSSVSIFRCAVVLLLLPAALCDDSCTYGGTHADRNGSDWTSALYITAVPAACMLLGSAVFLFVSFPPEFLAMMQNLSAGVLIAAIGNELFPLLRCGAPGALAPPGEFASYVGLVGGFLFGSVVMFGIDQLMDRLGEEEDDSDGPKGTQGEATEKTLLLQGGSPAPNYGDDPEQCACIEHFKYYQDAYKGDVREIMKEVDQLQLAAAAHPRQDVDKVVHRLEYSVDVVKGQLRRTPGLTDVERTKLQRHAHALKQDEPKLLNARSRKEALLTISELEKKIAHIHSHAHEVRKISTWRNRSVSVPLAERQQPEPEEQAIPWSNVAATCIDAAVDGLLIGLAYSANATAGLSMAIATSIEMGFLGLSFSAQIKASASSSAQHVLICAMPPSVLFGGGVLGWSLGAAFAANQALFIGCMSFALVALLYLVTQELMVEARETAGENVLINFMFFIGLLGGLILDKVLG